MFENSFDLFCCCILVLLIGGIILIGMYINMTDDDIISRNNHLSFCLDIYKSDNVVLDQCKDYFIIFEES